MVRILEMSFERWFVFLMRLCFFVLYYSERLYFKNLSCFFHVMLTLTWLVTKDFHPSSWFAEYVFSKFFGVVYL